ncbi:MAG: phosphoglycerate transporter [Dehalococcoidia bacterium]|nr:phosphoglycerate transporter [Dehalococcoidia bacterium]
MTLRLGWFTTARGEGSRAMYETVAAAIAAGELDAEFAFVFCNRDRGEDGVTDAFFELVRVNAHPLVTRSSVSFRHTAGGERSRFGETLPPWRERYDEQVERALDGRPFDLGVLAGYMLIFTAGFVSRHPLLNLHPALPGGPAGTWREVIRALIRGGARESGVMLHLAIAEVDAGPVVACCRYPIRGPGFDALWAELAPRLDGIDDDILERTPLFAAIRAEGVRYEAPLLLATFAEFAAARLRVAGSRVLGPGGAPREAVDLTSEVRGRLVALPR